MPRIGKVNKNILIKLYNDFLSIDCDVVLVKTELLNIITTYCEIDHTMYMSFDLDDYKVSLCKIYGLKISVGDDLKYMFCIKTGNIYCATNIQEYLNAGKKLCSCY